MIWIPKTFPGTSSKKMAGNKKAIEIGDLVKVTMLGSLLCDKSGIVAEVVPYPMTYDGHSAGVKMHPDEYSCMVLIKDPHDRHENGLSKVMVRAKWLEIVSKVPKNP